jgi:hypothetical protein
MKVSNIKDIEAFMKMVSGLKGKVYLVTEEGDQLNLKSKLSQLVALSNIFSLDEVPDMQIIAAEPEDVEAIVTFMREQ